MKTKQIILILAFFISINVTAQIDKIKGEGLISIKIDSYPTIDFYENTQDNEPIKSITIFDDKEIKSFNIKYLDSITQLWFKPLHLHLDYYIFFLQCTSETENWYQVIVNEKTDLKYWIKKSTKLDYITWSSFISNVVSVKPKDGATNPIVKSPDSKAEKCKEQLLDCLTPVEANGEWLKVKIEPAICDKTLEMEGQKFIDGFIRWKQGNKLLIDYWLLL